MRAEKGDIPSDEIPRICASYQRAIVSSLADRTAHALHNGSYRSLIVGGGVSLNGALREALRSVADKAGVELMLAKPKYCGDNAAMIAGLAYHRRELTGTDALVADVAPSLEAGD